MYVQGGGENFRASYFSFSQYFQLTRIFLDIRSRKSQREKSKTRYFRSMRNLASVGLALINFPTLITTPRWHINKVKHRKGVLDATV